MVCSMQAVVKLAAGALTLALAACSGGSGNPSGTGGSGGSGGGGGGGGGGGSGSYTLSSLDETCDTNGPSGNDVLALTQPSYQLALDYVAAQDAGADAGASTALTIALSYAGGAITCHRHVTAPPGTGMADQPASVDVTVHVTFSTSDGQFNETFDAPLSAASGASYASFNQSIAAADLKGSFQPTLSGVTNVSVSVGAQFEVANSWGNLMQGGQKSPGVGEVVPVGSWDNRTN